MSKVKICGLRTLEDIQAVNRFQPDYIGFVFAPGRRRIDGQTAQTLKAELDPQIASVGVFVNESIEEIIRLVDRGIIDMVQLHGDEDEDYIQTFRRDCSAKIIKAVGVSDALPPMVQGADYLLFDTASLQRGGTGKAFDWDILADYKDSLYFLAGGLTITNVDDAIRRLSPYCVDVSSGVETHGKKDAEKISALIQKIRRLG